MLSIHQLSKTYSNGVKALDDVTLEIPVGMFGLLGPNGAGKSSLMRTIATLQQPDKGSIRFGEVDVLKQPDEMRKTVRFLSREGVTDALATASNAAKLQSFGPWTVALRSFAGEAWRRN